MEADRMTDSCRYEGLLPGSIQLHRPSAHLSAEVSAQRFVEDILLISEPTAYVRLYDSYLPPWDPKSLPHDPPADMGKLGRCHDYDPPLFHIGVTDRILNMAVLDCGRLVPAFHLCKPRLSDRRLIISVPYGSVGQDIMRVLFMELGRAVLHRFLHIQHKGQLLILCFQGAHCLRGSDLILGHHCRNIVPVISDMFYQQEPVRHILVCLFC